MAGHLLHAPTLADDIHVNFNFENFSFEPKGTYPVTYLCINPSCRTMFDVEHPVLEAIKFLESHFLSAEASHEHSIIPEKLCNNCATKR